MSRSRGPFESCFTKNSCWLKRSHQQIWSHNLFLLLPSKYRRQTINLRYVLHYVLLDHRYEICSKVAKRIFLMLTSAITKWRSEWTNFCKCRDGGWQCRSRRVMVARAPAESLIRTRPARSADMSGTVGWASATPSLWPRFDTSKTPDGGRGARTPLLARSFHMFYCPLFHFSVRQNQYVCI